MTYDAAGRWIGSEPQEECYRRLDQLVVDAHNRAVIEFVRDNFNTPFVVIGDVGTGKTTLLAAVYRVKLSAWWTEAEELCSDTKRAIGRSRIDIPADEFAESSRCENLFIDDLGTERETDYNLETVVGILRSRFNHNRPTWISTNLSTDEIEKRYGRRIADRMFSACKVLEIGGPSRREAVA